MPSEIRTHAARTAKTLSPSSYRHVMYAVGRPVTMHHVLRTVDYSANTLAIPPLRRDKRATSH